MPKLHVGPSHLRGDREGRTGKSGIEKNMILFGIVLFQRTVQCNPEPGKIYF